MPLLLVVAIAIGFFALRGGPIFPPPNAIVVPDFANVSGSVAAQRLAALGLRPQPTEEPSETVRQGYVVRQDPPAGAKLAKDAAVTLVISGGLPRVQIPDVKGYSAADAQRALQAAKLRSKVAAQLYSGTVPAGEVIDVNPPVGSSLRENSVVALTVSKGIQPVTVPSIVSLKIAEARKRLAALGLTLSVTQQTESEAVPQDEIASQDPAAGTTVQPNTAGHRDRQHRPAGGRRPQRRRIGPATRRSRRCGPRGFVPTVTYNVDATNATQKVSAQRPDTGTNAKKGSSVTIYVSVPGTVPDVTGMSLDDAKKALAAAGYQIGKPRLHRGRDDAGREPAGRPGGAHRAGGREAAHPGRVGQHHRHAQRRRMTARRILGVDPGLRTTGYGVIEVRGGALHLIEGGVLQPKPDRPLEQRLVQLHDGIVEVLRATRPDHMVVEELWTAYEHPQTAVLMGHARGVLALAAGAGGVPVQHLAHTVVKRALTGSGSARKAQVKAMVVQLLGLAAPPEPDDVSDALALAIAFANVEAQRARFAELGVVMPQRRSRAPRLA